jgi:hypothetical protein
MNTFFTQLYKSKQLIFEITRCKASNMVNKCPKHKSKQCYDSNVTTKSNPPELLRHSIKVHSRNVLVSDGILILHLGCAVVGLRHEI